MEGGHDWTSTFNVGQQANRERAAVERAHIPLAGQVFSSDFPYRVQ